jgi:hypothetical protein
MLNLQAGRPFLVGYLRLLIQTNSKLLLNVVTFEFSCTTGHVIMRTEAALHGLGLHALVVYTCFLVLIPRYS